MLLFLPTTVFINFTLLKSQTYAGIINGSHVIMTLYDKNKNTMQNVMHADLSYSY